MKKIMILVVTALLAVGICLPAFAGKAGKRSAEKKFERIVASIVSIDPQTRTIVVTREENGESRSVVISEKALAQVQVGDRVRIKLKAGTNESAGVRILGPNPAAATVAAESEGEVGVPGTKADVK